MGICAFCGEDKKLTREHNYANWMKPYLPKKQNFSGHHILEIDRTNGSEVRTPSHGKLNRPGDPHSQRLKILCDHCNNVRLGNLQDLAKPDLLPLIQGHWSLKHGQHGRLAAWVVMTVLVADYANGQMSAFAPSVRKEFLNTLSPPDNWVIWLGRYDGSDSGLTNQVAWAAEPEINMPQRHKADSTIFSRTIGQLMVIAIAGDWVFPIVKNVEKLKEYEELFGLVRILPTAQGDIMPVKVYSDDWELPLRPIYEALQIEFHSVRRVVRRY